MGINRKTNTSLGLFMSKKLKTAVERSVSESTAAAHADLIKGSPVDTGRFRASWFHSQAPGAVPDDNRVAPEPPEGGTVPEPTPVSPSQVNGLDSQLIINNLPYATRLCEEGWSVKVPADWFKVIGHRWQTGKYLDEAFARYLNAL